MASIFKKIRTFVLSNVHALLDKAIDLNSIEAVKQHVRDLEDAIDETENAAAIAQGDMKTANDNVKESEARVAELQENIDFLLGDGDDTNDHLAAPLVEKLIGHEGTVDVQREEAAANQATLANLDEVISKLRQKHVEMLRAVSRLEIQERSAKAKDQAAEAIKHASSLGGETPSVDNIAQRITRQSNIADAKLKRAMGEFKDYSADALRDAKVAARLAQMKAKIKSVSVETP